MNSKGFFGMIVSIIFIFLLISAGIFYLTLKIKSIEPHTAEQNPRNIQQTHVSEETEEIIITEEELYATNTTNTST